MSKLSVRLKSIDRYYMGHHLFVEKKFYYSASWTFTAIMSYEASDYNELVDYTEDKVYILYAETLMKQSKNIYEKD